MPDTRIRITEALFEEKVTYADPRAWAVGDGFLYHQAMIEVPGWRTYGSAGFRCLTFAQQILLYWHDFVREVVNGGLSEFYLKKPEIIDGVRAAVRALEWPELSERLEAAHVAYIAPSKDTAAWRKELRKQQRDEDKRVLMLWRLNIQDLEPAPIWLWEFWGEHGQGPFNSSEARDAWRKHYRNYAPTPEMLMLVARDRPAIAAQTPEERAFTDWFCSDETRAQSRYYVPRFLRANKDQLAAIVIRSP